MAANVLKSYIITEQQYFQGITKEELKAMKLDFEKAENEVRYLNLCPFRYSVSYYLGIDWLQENESYILVKPKIDGLNYISMFLHCMQQPDIYQHLKNIYNIDFTRPPITIDTEELELTPILIIHFLFLLEKLVKQGLKKNYIRQEENLNGKIKGKIQFSKQLKHNIFHKREERIFCNYQDYSINCPENKVLKKALIFVRRYSHQLKNKYPQLSIKINRLTTAFEHVSDDISLKEIKQIKLNPVYKEYTETIRIAMMILKRFGYSLTRVDKTKENQLPPFWIDMSKLFELYVYTKLKEAYPHVKIDYQVHGKYGYVDFLDRKNKIIIDTKYKLSYPKERYDIQDIRQLSGYARDTGILKKLGYKDEKTQNEAVIDCVIIAPSKKSKIHFIGRELINEANRIKQFTKFYWCGIQLP